MADILEGYASVRSSENRCKLRIPKGTQANNECRIRGIVRGNGGSDSKDSLLLLTD